MLRSRVNEDLGPHTAMSKLRLPSYRAILAKERFEGPHDDRNYLCGQHYVPQMLLHASTRAVKERDTIWENLLC